MRRKFKSRRHMNFKFFRYLIMFFIVLFIGIILRLILNIRLFDERVDSLLEHSNIYSTVDIGDVAMNLMFKLVMVDINKPDTILQNVMFYANSNDVQKYYYVANDITSVDSDVVDTLPLVYIYNSHDTEGYADNYGVFDASFYLSDRLSEIGINSIVEENRTSSIRDLNGWNYNLSYKASRINLERVKSENPSIKIFIDLHRDSVGKNYTSVTIGDKGYAKVLFVVGKDHENYLDNLFFTQALDDVIAHNYPGLSKGILEKSGYGVNGIYNQDVSYNVILMEVGGDENTSDEVKNTLDVMANIIKEKIYE